MVYTLSYLPSGNGGSSTLLKSRSSVSYVTALLAPSEGEATIQAVAYDIWGASSIPAYVGINVEPTVASGGQVTGLLSLAAVLADPDLTTQVT